MLRDSSHVTSHTEKISLDESGTLDSNSCIKTTLQRHILFIYTYILVFIVVASVDRVLNIYDRA